MDENGSGSAVVDATHGSTDWRTYVTDEHKADPVVSTFIEKATEKDISSVVKGYAHLNKRLGNAINLPGKDAKPEEMTALKARLIEAGVMPKPIADPKEYGIAKPATLPPGLNWSDETANKLAATLHKYQVPKEAAAELLALHTEALGGVAQSLKVDQESAVQALKTEFGEQYDARREMVKRMMGGILKTPEELDFLEQTGMADHPMFLSVLMRLAPLAMQDSSFIESIPHKGGEITGEKAREEYAQILSDPKHPMYEGFKARKREAMDYVADLYRRAYGNEPVVI